MSVYVRKVNRTKYGMTYVELARIIPKDWEWIKIEVLERGDSHLVLKLSPVG